MERTSGTSGIFAVDSTLHYRKRSKAAVLRQGLLILLILSFLSSCKEEEIRILFTGDILLSRMVREEYQRNQVSPWHHMQELFAGADLVVGNLEGAVGTRDENSHPLCFDIRESDITLLRDAGFHVMTLENNHAFDLGEQGKMETIQALKNHGMVAVNTGNSPWFFTIKGVVVSIVAINTVPFGDSVPEPIPSLELMQKLRLAKTLSNVVIVSVHWGSELLDWPNKRQRTDVGWLTQNGADIIIGSHPHVIQQPEIINGKTVYFSLGNHLFDQKYEATKTGLIADIRIRKGKIQCTGITTQTAKKSFFPKVGQFIDYEFPEINLSGLFKTSGFTLLPISESRNGKSEIRLEAFRNNKKAWTTVSIPLVSVQSAKLDGEREYLFTLEKHYSGIDGETALRPYVYRTDEKGIQACWRGSALAWPLLDAHVSSCDDQTLCALHRGDSFIQPDKKTSKKRLMRYRWNGFGFSGVKDSPVDEKCEEYYKSFMEE